jgi:hypothetical protein
MVDRQRILTLKEASVVLLDRVDPCYTSKSEILIDEDGAPVTDVTDPDPAKVVEPDPTPKKLNH